MKTNWDEITPFRILVVILGIALIISVLPGCMVYEGSYTTKSNTHSCELMDRGQACLSDHSCCKDDSDGELITRQQLDYIITTIFLIGGIIVGIITITGIDTHILGGTIIISLHHIIMALQPMCIVT